MAETKSNTFNEEYRKVIGPLGVQLDRVDTEAKFDVGTVARDHRGGEYLYLLGVASNVQFAWVSYSIAGDITAALALGTTTTVDLRDPLGISCSAFTANEYGWVQIRGLTYGRYLVSMAKTSTVQSTATAGAMDDANTTTIYGADCHETEGGTGTDSLKTTISYPMAGIAL